MSFQFGTNWPGYMETVGNIAGPLLAYEILRSLVGSEMCIRDRQKMETERLVQLLRLGSKVYKLYEFRDRLKIIPGSKARKGDA